MKAHRKLIAISVFACLIIAFRFFAWDSFWNLLVYQSEKRDVLKVAELVSKFGPALGAIVIGLIASYIAWRQSKTASEKLRLDLFEKRYKVADQVGNFFREYHRTVIMSNELTTVISNAFYEGEFLFGDDFKEKMGALVRDAQKLKTLQIASRSSPTGSSFLEESSALDQKFQDQWPSDMWQLFAKYLRFPNIV